jgi:hypothetical protein
MHVMHRFLTRACAVAAAGAALSMGVVTAATASGGGGVPIRPGAFSPAGIVAGRGGAATPANSRYLAGYQATVTAGSATVATASFTVPTLSCTTVDLAISSSVAVPVNNYKTASIAGVFTGCFNGTAVYFPWLAVNGTETNYTATPFAAGDVVDLTTKVSTNRTRVQVTDVTTGVTQKIIGPGASASAAFIGDSPWFNSSNQLEHVPNFGKLTFKNCLIDGKALGGWHPQAIQRVNSIGTVQIADGGFWPGGTAFSTHYQHS